MNSSDSKKNNQQTFIFLISVVCAVILLIFLIRTINAGYGLCGKNVDFAVTGQIGDYIGGVIGTIFAGAGFYFLYVTLVDQRKANEKNSFESKFFELIRLHRENVSEMSYSKFYMDHKTTSQNRKVFKVLVNEFTECLKEVRHFSDRKDPEYYYQNKHKRRIENLIKKNELKINLVDFATIEVAYCIFYYGLNNDGMMILKNLFIGKYSDEFVHHLLRYMELKPKEENQKNFKLWKELYSKDYKEFEHIRRNIYFSSKPKHKIKLTWFEKYLTENYKMPKYYGGHQHRLGHYFRHLFQSYSFLNTQTFLNDDQKLFYGKLLRAQLSTPEQYLLFINSLTCIGRRWELDSKSNNMEDKMITFYNLITNLPGTHLYKIYYRDIYPKVKYESNDY